MKKIFSIALVALSALVMVACSGKQNAAEKPEGAAPEEMPALVLAGHLAQYGYQVESPAALIEAAEIIASTPVGELEEFELEREEAAAAECDKEDKGALRAEKLLEDARALAGEDAALLAWISRVEEKLAAVADQPRASRGAVRSVQHYDHVNGYSTDIYTISFYGQSKAEVAVIGDGDTDLDLYVYDENGNFIASDADLTDRCYVSFYPRWTGPFRIKIVNRGGVYNNYCLLTN